MSIPRRVHFTFRLTGHRAALRRIVTLASGTALAGALALAPAAPVAAASMTTVQVNTDSSWTYSSSLGGASQGSAEVVCLNSSYPSTGAYSTTGADGHCPTAAPINAVDFGFNSGSAWTLDLSPIPSAYFIWAGGVDGSTPTTTDSTVYFSTTVSVNGLVSSDPTFYLAADNFAQVFVNGVAVQDVHGNPVAVGSASSGSDTSAFNTLSSFTVPAADFPTGTNTITIEAANAPPVSSTTPYSSNPAGVVFGTTLSVAPGDLTTCTSGSGCTGTATSGDGTTTVSVTGAPGGSGTLTISFGGTLNCTVPYFNKPYDATSATFDVNLTTGASKIFDLTLTKAAALAASKPFAFQYFVCFNAPTEFTQLLGKPAPPDTTNGGYTGLLPFCLFAPAGNPCVQAEYNSFNGDVHIRFYAPAGDPRGYF